MMKEEEARRGGELEGEAKKPDQGEPSPSVRLQREEGQEQFAKAREGGSCTYC